jgi:hypothetical protein
LEDKQREEKESREEGRSNLDFENPSYLFLAPLKRLIGL